MEEYREVYLTEAEEMLHTMEEELLLLEQESSDEAVARLFRAAHTLKGSSAAMGYAQTNRLTHDMEHVLEKVRMRVWEVSAELATLLLGCVDRIRRLHQEIGADNREQSPIDDLLANLRRFGVEAKAPRQATRQKEPLLIQLAEEFAGLARLRLTAGEKLLRVAVSLDAECEMRDARIKVVEQRLAEMTALFLPGGSVTSGPEKSREIIREDGAWIMAGTLEAEALAAEVGTWVDVTEVSVDECHLAEEAQTAASLENEDHAKRARTTNATIRVNVERLEGLMNLAGELVIEQTRLAQVAKELERSLPNHAAVQDLSNIGHRLNRRLGDLQENVMKIRMLPIEQLFNRFPRMVRDLSRSLGKEIELVMDGKDTELDRTLIEELGDPLIHLIRNALDHGIEKPEARIAAGKPPVGRLRIGAYHEDNQILICLEDDGAGIDTARLLQKAVDYGVMTKEEASECSTGEAVDLIFHPGLSTASAVSDISGRGVGMDIVRSCIEKINGMIEVETTRGQGTVFRIRLPLTLAIGTGLLVSSCNQTYIIPMSNVAEIVRMEPSEIQMVKGLPVLFIRNKLVPVVWLHEIFGLDEPDWHSRHIPMVIIGRGEKRAAIAVEQLIGNQEIVIKPLGSFVGQVEGIAGATILGTGKVALILEIGELIKRFGRT